MTDADVQRRLAALEAAVVELRGIVGRSRGPRDDADSALVLAVESAAEGRKFTGPELFRHAAVCANLRAALLAADIENPRQLGRLLRRLERAPVGDLQVVRTGDTDRDGIVWRVLQV